MRTFRTTCLFIAALVASAQLCASEGNVANFVGDFSAIEASDSGHCEGYEVILWKKDSSLFGLLSHHRSLCGDPPTGILEEVRYSPSTGNLSFKARIWGESCIRFDANGRCVYSRDIVSFKGKLQKNELEGKVSWYNMDLQKDMRSENITLKRDRNPSDYYLKSTKGYDFWVSHWEKIVSPRWNSSK